MTQRDKSKTKQQDVFTPLAATSHSNKQRQEEDYYATDPTAIDDLIEKEDISDRIWEPACGQGHLSKRLEKHGKDVYSTDKINRGFGDEFFDFLNSDIEWSGDIVTNPPYKQAKEFVKKSLDSVEEGQKVAFFMKLTFLEGKSRADFLEQNPPRRVWVYSYRKTVAKDGDEEEFEKSSAVCYAWFVWEKGYEGRPEIGWIREKDRDQRTLG